MRNLIDSILKRIGLYKSILMYYWRPFGLRRMRRFYAQFIQPGDLCFDIGAHVGNRTAVWRDLGARVVAVEPQPVMTRYLRKQFLNDVGVIILENALADKPGKRTMYINRANPTISTFAEEAWREIIHDHARYPISWEETIEVEAITLDQMIEKYGMPVFCKIDVEGVEPVVLMGLSKPLPCLSIEYVPMDIDRTLSCIDILEKLGNYEFNWSFGESMRLASDDWLNAEQIKQILSGFSTRYEYGDVYARLLQ